MALQPDRHTLEQLTDFAGSWYWQADAKLQITHVSEGFFEFSELTPTDLVGAEIIDRAANHPDGNDNQQLSDALARRQPFRNVVIQRRFASGQLIWLQLTGMPIEGNAGTFEGYRGFISDITAQKQSELKQREYAAIINSTDDAIISQDLDGIITTWNAAAERLYGYSAEEAIGQHRSLVVGSKQQVAEQQELMNSVLAGRPVEGIESLRRRKDGSEFWLSLTFSPICDADGKVIGAAGIGRDISKQKAAEQALRQSEARFRNFAESASDWYWEMGPDLRFTYFSDRVEEVVGVPPEFHIGKTRRELAGEDATTDKWRRHLQDLDEQKPFRDFRYQRKGPNGLIQYLSTSGKPVFDEDGEFAGYIGIGSDLTGQLVAEERATLANERLAAAIDALSEPFVLWDPEDRLVVGNRRFRQLNAAVAGFCEPGTYYADFARALTDAGLIANAVGREEAWLSDRIAQHRNPPGPFEQQRSDGRWYIIHEQQLPDGSIATITTDITTIKSAEALLHQSEQRFKDFASVAADWFWEQDENLRFTEVTQDNVAVTGMEQQEHYGKTRRETGLLDVDEMTMAAHERDLLARKPFSDFRFARIRPDDGQKIHITVSGKPVFDQDGKFRGYRGAGRDITDIVMAQRELEIARDNAEKANQAKSRFLANMSHELRTPLNAIIGYSEIMKDLNGELAPLRQNFPSYAEYIYESGHHLLGIINDLLDLARIESGQVELDEEPIHLLTEFEFCIHALEANKKKGSPAIQIEAPPNLPPLLGDRRMIRQIMINLLSNSIKYAPGTIVMQAKLDQHGGIEIGVQDEGQGMSEDDIEKALQPFMRSGSAYTLNEEGAGLGLPIVKSCFEQHGGEMKVESVLGAGTFIGGIFPPARTIEQGKTDRAGTSSRG